MRKLPKRKEVKTESLIENIALREFNLLGFYPTLQFKVGPYRIDLAFPEHLIAIECDGREWHLLEEQISRDKKRDEYLRSLGWRVIRISGSEIYKKADEIIGVITGMKEPRIKRFQPKRIEINYEEMNFDTIEKLEEQQRFQQTDMDEMDVKEETGGRLTPISEIIEKRYYQSKSQIENFNKLTKILEL